MFINLLYLVAAFHIVSNCNKSEKTINYIYEIKEIICGVLLDTDS